MPFLRVTPQQGGGLPYKNDEVDRGIFQWAKFVDCYRLGC